ncbi:ankyrin repeat domain-containing protein 1 isoform X3 [Takifugu rubripes]|uniref:ankyrin repeat domain-containing protein 1 isoform X3 n=1 Tax=Takifugu rubripes TaxID=31033 RepID=UPI0011455179|nr:ankyrin repeat domain-containing protein 1 isoform X3 [Takifugu rubripes]
MAAFRHGPAVLWKLHETKRKAPLFIREIGDRSEPISSEGEEETAGGNGGYELSVSQEKQDTRSSEHANFSHPSSLRTDKAGRVILETTSDLQNLLILRQSKREQKCAVRRADAPPVVHTAPYYVDEEDFWKACDRNDLLVINRYLSTGGDVDACDAFERTGLHRACSHGNTGAVARLIEAGANIINSRDKLWSTCVHAACRGGHLSVLQLLLDHGADITAADKLKSSPLHVSVRTGHLRCVEFLIHNGASVNTQDREGDTPLHDAVRQSRLKIIQLLLLHGADTRVTNQKGRRPLDDVLEWQNETKTLLDEQADRK